MPEPHQKLEAIAKEIESAIARAKKTYDSSKAVERLIQNLAIITEAIRIEAKWLKKNQTTPLTPSHRHEAHTQPRQRHAQRNR